MFVVDPIGDLRLPAVRRKDDLLFVFNRDARHPHMHCRRFNVTIQHEIVSERIGRIIFQLDRCRGEVLLFIEVAYCVNDISTSASANQKLC